MSRNSIVDKFRKLTEKDKDPKDIPRSRVSTIEKQVLLERLAIFQEKSSNSPTKRKSKFTDLTSKQIY